MATARSVARVTIHSMKSELDATYGRYRNALRSSDIDLALQRDLHIYMCIRLSGYLEQLLFAAIRAFVSDSSGGPAREFALAKFNRSPNLTPDAFGELIGRFGEAWRIEIGEFLEESGRRELLGTLLRIRNDSAHGKSYSGSLLSVESYKKLIDEIHSWVIKKMIN